MLSKLSNRNKVYEEMGNFAQSGFSSEQQNLVNFCQTLAQALFASLVKPSSRSSIPICSKQAMLSEAERQLAGSLPMVPAL